MIPVSFGNPLDQALSGSSYACSSEARIKEQNAMLKHEQSYVSKVKVAAYIVWAVAFFVGKSIEIF